MSMRGIARFASFKRKSEVRPLYSRRKHDLNLARMTSVEIVSLEQSVNTVTWEDRVKPVVPLLAWAAWILVGALFYGIHDGFPFAQALFMSVNVGWSMGWVMEWDYERTVGNALFSTVHTSVGVVFIGTAVIYIAQEVGKNKDDWIMQMMKKKDLALAAETEGYRDDVIAFFTFYLPKLKIFFVFIVWFLLGMLWYGLTLSSSTNGWELVDFVLSSLSGGGYLAIESSSNRSQFVITSVYTTIGVPLMSIALGLVLSLLMEAPEDKSVFEKIVAGVTEEEIEFMKIFEIDDGDGTIDSKEFIILTVVRIGAAPPHLINQIHARFNILDCKHKGKISYDDLVLGRKKKATETNSFQGMLKKLSSSRSLVIGSGSEGAKKGGTPPTSSKLSNLNIQLNRVNSIKKLNMTRQKLPHSSPLREVESVLMREQTFGELESGDVETGEVKAKTEAEDSHESELQRGRSLTDIVPLDTSPPQLLEPVPVELHDQVDDFDHHEHVQQKPALMTANSRQSSMSVTISCSDIRPVDDSSHLLSKDMAVATSSSNKKEDDNDRCSSFRSIRSFDEDDENDDDQHEEKKEPSSETPLNTPPPAKKSGWHRMQTLNKLLPTALRNGNSASVSPQSLYAVHKSATLSQLNLDSSNKPRHAFREIAHNQEVLEKLQKAKEDLQAKQLQKKEEANNKATLLLTSKQAMQSLMRNVYFFCFTAWFAWLLTGTIFYTLREEVSVLRGVYMSVSVGYGIFWVELEGDSVSRAFTTFHFIVGIFAIALAMAIFARTLVSAQKNWYIEAMNKRKYEEAQETEGYKDDIIAAFVYYWPKLKIYFYFMLWVFVGIAFCLGTDKWSFVDSLYFSVSAMSTGGFLNIEDSSPEWHFLFVAVYVIVGVPIMAIACGLLAHQIANIGRSDKLDAKINAQVTEDELAMMKLLNIEDGDGHIDGTEFTILVLVRIGALNPDLIGVLYERFNDLDVKQEGKITYDDLQMKHEEGGAGAMKGMVQTGKIHTRLGYG